MKTNRLWTPLRTTLLVTSLALGGATLQMAQAAPRDGGGGGEHGDAGMMMMHGRGMDRMLEQAGVSAEQRQQMRQTMQAAAAETKPQRDSMRTLRAQMAQLFGQTPVDGGAIEQLRLQMAGLQNQISQRMTAAMVQASGALTPTQRQQIAAMIAQRGERMQRHGQDRQKPSAPGT